MTALNDAETFLKMSFNIEETLNSIFFNINFVVTAKLSWFFTTMWCFLRCILIFISLKTLLFLNGPRVLSSLKLTLQCFLQY